MNRRFVLIVLLVLALGAVVAVVVVRRPVEVAVPTADEPSPIQISEAELAELAATNTLPNAAMRTTAATTTTATTSSGIPPGRLRFVRDPVVAPGERFVKVPVLMYHYVRPVTPTMDAASRWLSVSPEHFKAQMDEIMRLGYHTITPDDLADAVNGTRKLPTKPVLLTFDDGYRDQYTDAFPILKEDHLKATFFIVSAYHVNPTNLTNDMIREVDASGFITIAAHTKHHVGLVDLKPDKRKDEIFGSKKELEDVLGHPVTAFAYPYGNFNDEVKALVRDAGFRISFSTLLGSIHTSSSILEVRRIRVLDDEFLEPVLKKFGS